MYAVHINFIYLTKTLQVLFKLASLAIVRLVVSPSGNVESVKIKLYGSHEEEAGGSCGWVSGVGSEHCG